MILEERVNSSLYCLLPLIGFKNFKFSDYIDIDNSFINGYSADINRPWLDSHLFMMYSSRKSTPLQIVNNLTMNENFVQQYTYRIDGLFYTIYVFKIPNEFKRDYELMKNGDYTKILHSTKVKILQFWNVTASSDLFSALFSEYDRNRLTEFCNDEIKEKDYIEPYLELEHSLI